ncbi:hypothetical protein GE21DRAFT_1290459 [Neurospora crassa]|nr:hypothetical protein GE21DRAFT_1290459 [Neurospora crassa]
MKCRSVCETGPPFLGRGRVQHNLLFDYIHIVSPIQLSTPLAVFGHRFTPKHNDT